MKKLLSLISLLPALAFAHEGHGMDSASHYHATDAWGFFAALAVIVAMWWMGRDK